MLFATCTSLLSLIASVAAHGYVQQETVGGTVYTGYLPYQDPYYNPVPQRIIRYEALRSLKHHSLTPCTLRKIPGNGPVTDLSLIDVQCNGWSEGGVVGSAPAPLVASVAPGATVTFNWTTWPDSHKGRE
jgi:hypothetical protein